MNTVIIGNGFPPPAKMFQTFADQADYIIAADGGAKHCNDLGILPDLLIGDLDSVSSSFVEELQTKTQIYKFPRNKAKTDLRLALLEAERSGAKKIQVFSWADERLDYSLSAILDFSQVKVPAEFFSHRSHVFLLNSFCSNLFLNEKKNTKLSLFPLPHVSLKTKGLKWDVDWTDISLPTFSQSNETLGPAEVKLSSGAAFVLLEKDHF